MDDKEFTKKMAKVRRDKISVSDEKVLKAFNKLSPKKVSDYPKVRKDFSGGRLGEECFLPRKTVPKSLGWLFGTVFFLLFLILLLLLLPTINFPIIKEKVRVVERQPIIQEKLLQPVINKNLVTNQVVVNESDECIVLSFDKESNKVSFVGECIKK